MKALSDSFLNDLKSTDGLLRPIVERVRHDHTLMLAIRDNYINIYYRGGNLLRIQEQAANSYGAFFDTKYNKDGRSLPDVRCTIRRLDDTNTWIKSFPQLKEIMDLYFSDNNKPEREFQQLVVRENNFSSISNESEYFIADIEFADSNADSKIGARFDMLAIRWLASHRKNGSNCRPALIEMKYGDKALDGNSGLIKHLQDIDTFISNRDHYAKLLSSMEAKFNQLDALELLRFNRSTSGTKVKLDMESKPEVIIILANHNPRSTQLRGIITKLENDEIERSSKFDLKFFVASFAGYSMHADCMLSLTQFRELLKRTDIPTGKNE